MPYRFDRFVFDPERGLVAEGQPVPLEPQVADILRLLIENRDRVVSRDELVERIWNGRIVSEAALSTQIRAVRRALGDDREQQRYIRTYPKRGFQFVADAEPIDEPPADRVVPRSGWQAKRAWALGLVVALVLAIGFWWGTRPGETAAEPNHLSIAVMPFDNLSGDPEQDYLADAFTEDLITDLSRIRDAFVIARRTSFTYKNREVDVGTVAHELNVRYVLEGSIRRSGDMLRVNAQLIDGTTRSHVWSDRFDRELNDAFSVQNDVTGRIASALKAELREAENRRQPPAAGLKAWDYALKGNVLLFNPKSLNDFREAKELLETATELDPGISSAWSGLAFVHFAASLSAMPGVTKPNSKDLSLQAAQRAVEADPKNAEGHWMIGIGYARNGQPERGMASCETAAGLNPNNDCAYVCAGLTNMALGRPAEAIPNFERSLRLNPRFRPQTKYKYMGLAHIEAGQDELAIDALNRALVGSPNDPLANFALAAALALQGDAGAAEAALEKALSVPNAKGTTIETMRASYGWMGPHFERVIDGLRSAGMPEHVARLAG